MTAYHQKLGDPNHLDASLDDFRAPLTPPPTLPPSFVRYPSAHSGFVASSSQVISDGLPGDEELLRESMMDENASDLSSLSAGGYSPPAWRRLENGDRSAGFWRRNDNLLGLGVDRRYGGASPMIDYFDDRYRAHGIHGGHDDDDGADDDDDIVLEQAIRTRLPTGSLSPEKGRTPDPGLRDDDDTLVKLKSLAGSPEKAKREIEQWRRQSVLPSKSPEVAARENYIRFAVRADIQQRTEPIEAAITFVRSKVQMVTKSWANLVLAALVALLSITTVRSLFQPASQRPVPDLIKVAGIARAFEPLIYYSENGVSQVGDLQATGVAVWDLGESVRTSNMTSAPLIVRSLDELSDSLKTLAIELTKFFANVDGDIDGILIVMDWARRELTQLRGQPSPPLATAWANIHNVLCDAGVLENPSTGTPTRLGAIATSVFGMSQPQRTRTTLQRTFAEFLSVLEEAINNELQHSLALFGLFEAIDRQFLNLARIVVRESSLQDDRHADDLSSLWTRILGPKASEVQKYERNRQLLQNVREKTVMNKGILVEHNGKLLTLKANLESLRRKLVSPLVRSVNSSTLSVEEQVKGLEDVGLYLEGVRTRQKGKLMEMLYGSSSRPSQQVGSGSGTRVGTIDEGRWASGY
ncbi:hypothetical protein PFICI_09940 [Pestalotiopsis fici W106-1]|uniref:Uncharacterized protein n=1 Tax=Pestalotiopsis fici (strain W106-1 / CGMCC3.15140) TaxID=1229662 RepID=W3WVH8_PESFW|nr:uncharacterized protein PFICI_09940 [Pestalotiopsis fici W106-1]ETS77878.1 hypothetical protein PFICI_09940 [Pestalotiopsis fici W106-1]